VVAVAVAVVVVAGVAGIVTDPTVASSLIRRRNEFLRFFFTGVRRGRLNGPLGHFGCARVDGSICTCW